MLAGFLIVLHILLFVIPERFYREYGFSLHQIPDKRHSGMTIIYQLRLEAAL
jgi:hypothetical protein